MVRDGYVTYNFAFFNVAMTQLKEPMTIEMFSASDSTAVARLIIPGVAKIANFERAVEAKHKNKEHNEIFENVPEDAQLSEYLLAANMESFVCVSLCVNAEHITSVYPPLFWDRLSTFPESLQEVARQARTEFDQILQHGVPTYWTFTFPHTTGSTTRWEYFSSPEIKQSPRSRTLRCPRQ